MNQNKERITDIVIAGGGTAGWMAAAALSKVLPNELYNISLVESADIGTVGVGEATIPQLRLFNNILGINEFDFLSQTQGTYKLGIEFANWGEIGQSYMHPFGSFGTDFDQVNFYHYWQRLYQAGKCSNIDKYSLNAVAGPLGKFMQSANIQNSPLSNIAYAYHFDAGKYALFLRKIAEERKVNRIEGMITDVTLNDENGFINSLILKSGQEIKGDLFIDCSGIRALLIEGALKTGYQDWTHYLPCNSAVTVQSENPNDTPRPYTQSIAHSAGWQWRIPLQHRTGNGHVYASDFMSDDEATSILLDNIEGKVLTDPRIIRFTTGMRNKIWNKNCVALGLSSGFMEPLESTSIHLVQSSISKLLAIFPHSEFNQVEIDKFNEQVIGEYLSIRDFIICHYKVTQRTDSRFWNHCRLMDIPDSLQQKIDLYNAAGRVYRDNNELFCETSWLAVLNGQGEKAQSYHPLTDAIPEEELIKRLQTIQEVVQRSAEAMPTHGDFINKHCKAKA